VFTTLLMGFSGGYLYRTKPCNITR